MSLHVEQLVSEVTTEDQPAATARRAQALWEQLAMFRCLQARALLDEARTGAFGAED